MSRTSRCSRRRSRLLPQAGRFNQAAPVTLEELRSSHPAPEYEVSVLRREEPFAEPNCDGGGACVLSLPFVALERLGLERWDVVTVKRPDVVAFGPRP